MDLTVSVATRDLAAGPLIRGRSRERVASRAWREWLPLTAFFSCVTALPDLEVDFGGRSLFAQDVLVVLALIPLVQFRRSGYPLLIGGPLLSILLGILLGAVNGGAPNLIIRDVRPVVAILFGLLVALQRNWPLKTTSTWAVVSIAFSAVVSAVQAATGIPLVAGRVDTLTDETSLFRVLTEATVLSLAIIAVGVIGLFVDFSSLQSQDARDAIRRLSGPVPMISSVVVFALSFSRSSVIAIAVATLLGLVFGARFVTARALERGLVVLVSLVIGAIALYGVAYFLHVPGVAAVASNLTTSFNDRVVHGLFGDPSAEVQSSNEARDLENAAALSTLRAFPVFGTGFGVPYRGYFKYELHDPGYLTYLHNVPLLVGVRLGLVGILLLLVPAIVLSMRGLLLNRGVLDLVLSCTFIGLLVSSLASPALASYGGAPIVGVCVGALAIRREVVLRL